MDEQTANREFRSRVRRLALLLVCASARSRFRSFALPLFAVPSFAVPSFAVPSFAVLFFVLRSSFFVRYRCRSADSNRGPGAYETPALTS